VEELPDDLNEALPCLPYDYPFILERESHFTANPVPDPDNETTDSETEPDTPDSEEEWFDAEEGYTFTDKRVETENEHCAECAAATATTVDTPRNRLHIDIEHVNEDSKTPIHAQRSGIPDISTHSVITIHSSKRRVSLRGDSDQAGISDNALDNAIHIMHMCRMEADEKLEGPEPVNSNDRLSPLRRKWFEKCEDLMGPIPEKLPPFREINHEINLIDDDMAYNYHMPRCSDALRPQLRDKINRYVRAGWWEMRPVPQAAPLLCIHKKTGLLRTVVDARKRNDNMVKDITPFPDQDNIRMDVARAKYRSKIDMSDPYEQVRIRPDDVWKTAFATTFGTAVSNVMLQGDCNAPATFQRLMTWIFRDEIGSFVHVYLDDIFVFSDSVEDHEKHLKIVFDKLRKEQLYLSKTKCDLYSKDMDCLGHRITDRGLHVDSDKMARILEWRAPRSHQEVM
jgi:hypothetical protein